MSSVTGAYSPYEFGVAFAVASFKQYELCVQQKYSQVLTFTNNKWNYIPDSEILQYNEEYSIDLRDATIELPSISFMSGHSNGIPIKIQLRIKWLKNNDLYLHEKIIVETNKYPLLDIINGQYVVRVYNLSQKKAQANFFDCVIASSGRQFIKIKHKNQYYRLKELHKSYSVPIYSHKLYIGKFVYLYFNQTINEFVVLTDYGFGETHNDSSFATNDLIDYQRNAIRIDLLCSVLSNFLKENEKYK